MTNTGRIAQRLTLDHTTVAGAVLDHLPAAPTDQDSPLGLPQRPVLTTDQEPASRYAEVATTELAEQARHQDAQLAEARWAARENAARVEVLAGGGLVHAEQDRQRQLLERAATIQGYRADRELLERMRPEWIRRSVEITNSEERIAAGGRRAARQETERLTELRRQQDHAGQQVRAAGARINDLEPHLGDTDQQDKALAEAALLHQNRPALIAAVRDRQETELADRQAAAPDLQRAADDAQRDRDELHQEQTNRPDSIDKTTLEPSAFDRLVAPGIHGDNHIRTIKNVHEMDQDIER